MSLFTERNIHPEAKQLATLALGAALLGDQRAVHGYNRQLVDWHRQRSDCPLTRERAARTIDYLDRRCAAPDEPDPPPQRREHGELRREVLETLLAADQPLSAAQIGARIGVERTSTRNVLLRLLDAGVVAELPARGHRRHGISGNTRSLWTLADRAGQSA